MHAEHIWANLGVADTKRTEKFYTEMGFKPNCPTTEELASFLFGNSSFVIHFFRRDKLEAAMNDKTTAPGQGSEIIFSLSAKTEEEVNHWADNAEKAGGSILKKAGRQEDGYYYCVFADPDGHKFNALFIEKGM